MIQFDHTPLIGVLKRAGRLLALCLLLGFSGAAAPLAADLESMWEALSYQGVSPETHRLVMAWEEAATWRPALMLTGMRVQDAAGGGCACWYWSADTGLMTEAAALHLGLKPKNWTQPAFQQAPWINPGFPKQALSARPQPKTAQAPEELALPPVDQAGIDAEDALLFNQPPKEGARMGVFRELPEPVSVSESSATAGAWEVLEDGSRIWAVSIRSPEALGQRIHFDVLALPEGARLIVYNTDQPEEAIGPLKEVAPFWTPTCFAASVTVECWIPASAAGLPLSIHIDQITHQYKDIVTLAKSAGGCNLDIACYEEWESTGLGVGGIGSIGRSGVLWCTGALLTDAENSGTPWFLTANHCINSNAKASTIEVYWLYAAEGCNEDPPDVLSIPRTTGGAQYLAGTSVDVGTDFALLKLNNDPPAGLVYLGYAIEATPLGSPVTCIHHPSGDYKRISFGESVDSGSPEEAGEHLKPLERFLEVLWTEGTTEPGSSGSPLFLGESQLIIGQLWGGYASCYAPAEPDYFGRFDLTFPLVESRLGQPLSPYDVNKSGAVNAADLQVVINSTLGRAFEANADVNGDGAVDAVDIQLVQLAILNAE